MELFSYNNLSMSTPTTIGDFYCQAIRYGSVERSNSTHACLSLSDFAKSPLQQICPTGSCYQDCQDPSRLFQLVPQGISADPKQYGSPFETDFDAAFASGTNLSPDLSTMVTFYGVCLSFLNISTALQHVSVPESQKSVLAPFFQIKDGSEPDLVAQAASQCLIDTCNASKGKDNCSRVCNRDSLMTKNQNASILLGSYECLTQLCRTTYGLPYGNADVVGIGVTMSFIIQPILVLICWLGLVGASVIAHFRPHRTGAHKSKEIFLESLSSFQEAQCYFTISVALASLKFNPPDMQNRHALLPVTISGFLPPIFTLLLLHKHGKRSWFMSGLTMTSWFLSTIVLWRITPSLWNPKIGLYDKDYKSIGSVESCGGFSAVSLCTQTFNINPLAYLFQRFLHAAVPSIWLFCTLCLFALLGRQYLSGIFDPPSGSPYEWLNELSRSTLWTTIEVPLRKGRARSVWYYATSLVLLVAIFIQGVLFADNLKLVDPFGWTFGQVIAITVWIPPVFDYLHLQFKESIERAGARLQPLSSGSKKQKSSPLVDEEKNQIQGHAYERVGSPGSIGTRGVARYGFEAAEDEVESETPLLASAPNAFMMRSRPTIRMEAGA